VGMALAQHEPHARRGSDTHAALRQTACGMSRHGAIRRVAASIKERNQTRAVSARLALGVARCMRCRTQRGRRRHSYRVEELADPRELVRDFLVALVPQQHVAAQYGRRPKSVATAAYWWVRPDALLLAHGPSPCSPARSYCTPSGRTRRRRRTSRHFDSRVAARAGEASNASVVCASLSGR
jgi:hypothetical protein